MGKRETEGSVQRDGIVKKAWLEIASFENERELQN